MANIQDIHAFEEKIYDIVQDYIDENYDVDDEGQKEPDVDKINDIANSWVFLD